MKIHIIKYVRIVIHTVLVTATAIGADFRDNGFLIVISSEY